MKKLLILFLFIIPSFIYSQDNINIVVDNNPSDVIQFKCNSPYNGNGVFSSIVFSLKYDNNSNISLGDGISDIGINLYKSGEIHYHNGYNYQIYVGFGFSPTLFNIADSILFQIDRSGDGDISIADDEFIFELNGKYYVSINGEDRTGEIINSGIVTSIVKPVIIYDAILEQYIVRKYNNSYYDMSGKELFINRKIPSIY